MYPPSKCVCSTNSKKLPPYGNSVPCTSALHGTSVPDGTTVPCQTKLGFSVATNAAGFVYFGAPDFNKDHTSKFSVGGIHVGLWM